MANLVLSGRILQNHAFNKWAYSLCCMLIIKASLFLLFHCTICVCLQPLMLHSMSTNCPLIIIFQILSILTWLLSWTCFDPRKKSTAFVGASDMINVLFMQRPHKIFLPEWLARMIYGQEFPFLRNFSCFAHVSKDLKDYNCLFWAP